MQVEGRSDNRSEKEFPWGRQQWSLTGHYHYAALLRAGVHQRLFDLAVEILFRSCGRYRYSHVVTTLLWIAEFSHCRWPSVYHNTDDRRSRSRENSAISVILWPPESVKRPDKIFRERARSFLLFSIWSSHKLANWIRRCFHCVTFFLRFTRSNFSGHLQRIVRWVRRDPWKFKILWPFKGNDRKQVHIKYDGDASSYKTAIFKSSTLQTEYTLPK